ncbi:hypothetical protein SAMN05216215_103155 [Saccharopolyspora shandongensis]|uniref:Uncharacterized protein n=1 Tax=Saccharopolyspora shandongensis TaxID=418495 RepID=A0A1H3LHA6_9PSEU|nr:hypothetical protein [Saccharopolyspora shandongensis]SDY63348.1 hypothetical protein SAMN05216215_103155 [Saccharopolyspora shandongensis]
MSERTTVAVNEPTLATFEEKTEHLRVVAERGADARKRLGAISGWPQRRAVRVRAVQVWNALSVLKTGPLGYRSVWVMHDTPSDGVTSSNIGRPTPTISRSWAEEVRRTFITAFCTATPDTPAPRINGDTK